MHKLVTSLIFMSILGCANAACPPPIPALPPLPLPFVPPPPVATCPTPSPTQLTGYLPITFVNNSNVLASDIYIAVLVNSSTQYLSFTPSGPHFIASISNFTPTTYISSTQYSTPLAQFESIAPNTYTFYIPNDGNTSIPSSNVMKSSRILVSLYSPMTYFVNNNGVVQFPSEFDATNDNYFILNDKIEFDLGSNGHNRLNLNLTGVDFFGLPLLVQANYQFLFGTTYSNACGVTGMPASVSLYDVFSQYATATTYLQPPFDTHWNKLIATYINPDSSVSTLRIFAPATAMGSSQTQTNPSPVSFPVDYFLAASTNPASCSWFDGVWSGVTKSGKPSFYANRQPTPYLILDATTAAGAATATGCELSDGSFRFDIDGGADNGNKVIFPYPTSSKAFFTGAVADYQPPITGTTSAATNAQVLKVFATAIIGGFFPINCKTSTPFTITNTYLQNNVTGYFENNPDLVSELTGCPCVSNIPWYDFYSRTLLTIGTPNLFYTSAYSDFLGCDGTIVITSLDNNNANATITVNINDCTTSINPPAPYSDATVYSVTVGIPATGVTAQYSTSATGPWSAISNPISVPGNTFFLQVTYTSGVYNGQTFVTQIAPAAKIFHPILPGQGTITTTGTNSTVSLGVSPNS